MADPTITILAFLHSGPKYFGWLRGSPGAAEEIRRGWRRARYMKDCAE